MLAYVDRISEKHNCFYELILKENIYLTDISNHDMPLIDMLVELDLIVIEDDIIKINDYIAIRILKDIYDNEVISYWKLEAKTREKIDILVKNNLLKFSSSLLSIPESDYLNYNLNKRKFSNSLDLKNMYDHGTQPVGDEDFHKSNYMTILRLYILVMIKINDELCINESNLSNKKRED
jgi:hypothetical protein